VNRKQFIATLAILLLAAAGTFGVVLWQRASYEATDSRVGQKLVAGFKIDEVAEIALASADGAVTLVRGEQGWTVKERGGYPADFERIRDFLVRLQEIKVVQVEGLTDALKPRLQLAPPASGGKPESIGTAVELKARDGKTLAQLVLGKQSFKQAQVPGLPDGIASGRYVWVAADPQRVSVVSEPFAAVAAKPASWLARDYLRVEGIKSLASFGPNGSEKWSVSKADETSDWKLAGPGELDKSKVQDAASALGNLQLADVASGKSEAEAGLDRSTKVRAQTLDGWAYEVRIGNPAPEDRYYVKSSVTGTIADSRASQADEKPEDKEQADRAFAERKEALTARLGREQAASQWIVLVPKSRVEPLLRDRQALLVEKPKAADKPKAVEKPKASGKQGSGKREAVNRHG
jgi:hypothetical protein